MTSLNLPIPYAGNGLDRYLAEIRKFPMLEPEEEYMLAKRFHEHQDLSAAHRLVTSHLRLVAKIAMKFRGYGLPVSELISEGNIGLMQAVKKFDPEKGFRLSTYAMWWIKASIQEFILRSWSLVKLGSSAAQKKLFFNLRKVKGQIHAFEEGDLTPENTKMIAEELDVSEDEVIAMNRRLSVKDQSLHAPLGHESEDQWIDMLTSEEDSTHEDMLAEREIFDQRKAQLATALQTLNPREQAIIQARRLKDDPDTLETLSQEYGVSRERIRQIEVRAMQKLEQAMTGEDAAA